MAATLGREEGKHLPVLSSGFLFGKEKTRGERNVVQKRGSCFSVMGESVADG